jgi:phage-related protein
MPTVGPSVREIRIRVDGAYRIFYVATFAEAVYVLHAFQKKTQRTAAADLAVGRQRFRALVALRQQGHEEKDRD